MFVPFSAFVLSLGFSLTVSAAGLEAKSAKRDPNVSYKAYMMNAALLSRQESMDPIARSPQDAAVTAEEAAKIPATAWLSAKDMNANFAFLRDLRFIESPNQPNFKRRSSWLYPDDGCFARAGLAIKNIAAINKEPPSKIFAFGNLNVKTANAPGGSVSWWYHVAPIVEVNGQKYVLDPALNPKNPLPMMEWLKLMGDPKKMEVAICQSGAYTPGSSCDQKTDGMEKSAGDDQVYYLDAEWERLVDLKRDPRKELGDEPPWM